jgi:hypothetical protein
MEDEDDDDDGDGFDTGGRGIFLFVALTFSCELEVYLTKGTLAEVCGPQLGERLAHRTDGILHCSRADRFVLGGATAIAVTVGKYLDDEDGVIIVSDKGVNVVLKAKGVPERPMCLRCFDTLISDALSGLFLDKANIKAESVLLWSGNICQGIVCGKSESK